MFGRRSRQPSAGSSSRSANERSAAVLEVFRAQAWRRGIDRKLAILRETYAMLNDEAQAARAELLEVVIVVPIVLEVLLGLLRRGSG